MFESEPDLIAALIDRDESAYRHVIREYQAPMLGLARSIVGEKIADEVVQEAWFSVMRALPKFERRSSLKTWVMRIVANEAKTRLRKESRNVSLEGLTGDDPELAARFNERGHWIKGQEPATWGADSPEDLLSSEQLEDCLELVFSALPELQAATIRLREQEGHALKEICNILDVSESNVRVLLHRARARVFNAIDHFENTGECCET
jgi:RNA polymerase sigma-70 factor (ECF subfamily)